MTAERKQMNIKRSMNFIKRTFSIVAILLICVSGQTFTGWAAQTTTDDEWELITSATELTKDGTYIIVSGTSQSGYMIGTNGTTSKTAAATSISITRQSNGNYKLNMPTTEAYQWDFTQSGTGYTIQNLGNSRYLSFNSKTSDIISTTSRAMTMSYSTSGGSWTIRYGEKTYLAYKDSKFQSIDKNENNQMRIFRLVESTPEPPEPPEPPVPEDPELVVTKEWNDNESAHDPVTVYLYKKGVSAPVDELELSDANDWSGKFTDLDPVSSTELGYYVTEETVEGYISRIGEIKRSKVTGTVWVPSRSTNFVAGREYALYSNGRIITRNGTTGLATKTVNLGGQVVVNGITYSTHILDGDVGSTGNWAAASNGSYYNLSNGGYYIRNTDPMVGTTEAAALSISSYSNGTGFVRFNESKDDKVRYLRVGDDYSVSRVKKSSSGTRFQLYEKVVTSSDSDVYSVKITNTPVRATKPDMEPVWSKKIDYLGDGGTNPDTQATGDDLYRLYMDIDTATEPIDLILVLDSSSSMNNPLGSSTSDPSRYSVLDRLINGTVTSTNQQLSIYNYPGTRENGWTYNPATYAGNVSRAADGFVYKFLNANPKNRIAALGYGNTVRIESESNPWRTKQSMPNHGANPKDYFIDTTHNGIEPYTNYMLALKEAKENFLDTRTNANSKTVMVFMTDGEPNKYVDEQGNRYPTGTTKASDEDAGEYAANYLRNTIYEQYPDLEVYTVGISEDATSGIPKSILENMAFSVGGDYYGCDDANHLTKAIEEILNRQRMTPLQFTDKLSEYADFADNPEPKITMKNKISGQTKTLWISSGATIDNVLNGKEIITRVDFDNTRITATVNPDLVLDDEYIFTLSYNIKAADTARQAFANSGYSNVGDSDTDYDGNSTSSRQDGFRSNEKASVMFKSGLLQYEAECKHPVIQVPAPPEPPEQDIRKWVDAQNDGSYDLSLSATGLVGGIKPGEKVDILMIVDTTKSMEQNFEGSKSRWDALEDAVEDVVDRLDSGGADARMALVGFSGGNSYSYPSPGNTYADATYNVPWTNNIQSIPTALTQLSLGGSTNYEAPFALINRSSILDNARTDAKKIVMFITDGMPNMYYENGHSKDDDDAEWYGDYTNSMTHAQNQITQMTGKMDAFYAISVGTSTQLTLLQELQGYSGVNGNAFVCTDSAALDNALSAAFGGTAEATQINGTYIEDTLSSNVELTADAKLTLTVKDSSGNTVKTETGALSGTTLALPAHGDNPAVTFTASYNAASRKITVSSSDEYTLEEGWTYTVATQIKPSQTAIAAYNSNKTYPDTGGDDTGTTSDGKQGFKSNDTAKFSYSYYGIGHTQDYKNPVVQIKLNTINISKIDAADMSKKLEGAKFNIYRLCESTETGSVSIADAPGKYGIKINGSELVSQTGSDITVDNLNYGTYFLTEVKAPDGYNALTAPIMFDIEAGGITTADGNAIIDQNNSLLLKVKNARIYELPDAGGIGTYIFYLFGTIIMVLAGSLFRRKSILLKKN